MQCHYNKHPLVSFSQIPGLQPVHPSVPIFSEDPSLGVSHAILGQAGLFESLPTVQKIADWFFLLSEHLMGVFADTGYRARTLVAKSKYGYIYGKSTSNAPPIDPSKSKIRATLEKARRRALMICGVCNNKFELGKGLRKTSCGHTFHAKCLKEALIHKVTTCPSCPTSLEFGPFPERSTVNTLKETLMELARDGNLEVFKKFINLEVADQTQLFELAKIVVEHARLPLLEYLLNTEKFTEIDLNNLCIKAAESGSFLCLRELLSKEVMSVDTLKSSLLAAAEGGHLDCFEHLFEVSYSHGIDQKGEITYLCDNVDFAADVLAKAAENGHLEMVKLMVDKRLLRFRSPESETRLVFSDSICFQRAAKKAARRKLLNVVELLIEYSIEKLLTNGSALIGASEKGHLKMVQMLLESGGGFEQQMYEALRLASANGHLEIVRMLLESGEISEEHRSEALEQAFKNGHLEVVQAFFENVVISDQFRSDAIKYASKEGYLEIVRMLLESGEISEQSRFDAIWGACIRGHSEIVRKLLESGKISDEKRSSLVQRASAEGQLEIVKMLLANGKISEQGRSGAVWQASLIGHSEIVRLLLENGEISKRCRTQSVLFSSEKGHFEIVRMLLESGEISEQSRYAAIEFASEEGQLEIVRMLLENENLVTDQLNEALLRAVKANQVKKNHLEVVEFLINNVNFNSEFLTRAIQVAKENNCHMIADIIEAKLTGVEFHY